jgi:hypothetical protein
MDSLTRDYYAILKDFKPTGTYHGKVIALYGEISEMELDEEKYLDTFPNFIIAKDF